MLSRRMLDANPHRTRNGWIPLAIIIFIMIVLLFVAICIVLSLLPTYLPDKNISVTTTNGQSTFLNARYLTNGDLTGKTVANKVSLGQQLSTQLGIPSSALSVQSAQFQNTATTGKRKRLFLRILSTLRESTTTTGTGTKTTATGTATTTTDTTTATGTTTTVTGTTTTATGTTTTTTDTTTATGTTTTTTDTTTTTGTTTTT
ncbi:unnamed protein product [Rotaria socialis]|uniref:Uncharacterized protein n=1 Tax=Rotaria socialis TaxID=392032 RepID=A0A821SPW5_9BILA|nr:unnamed protein product [Rotaria socialis]